jgi:hypothetical protein
MAKEQYKNNQVLIEYYDDGRIWLQNGVMGLWFKEEEMSDLVELIDDLYGWALKELKDG